MHIVGVILAGGRARRMGGRDKALVKLAGKRLIEHVLARLAPQVDSILIAGPSSYGSGWPTIADLAGGAEGPVAGIRAACNKLEAGQEDIAAMVTAPVDCPLLPTDLAARLSAAGGAAIAEANGGLQPAFGYWPLAVIAAHIGVLERPGGLSLQRWAEICGAGHVAFPDPGSFLNINSEQDLAAAELRAGAGKKPGSP